MKILLLEDDAILAELISEYLQKLGHEVESFYDGESALKNIEKSSYDLLLLDLGVPYMDGFELLSYLKESRITTPSIFITSLSGAKDFEKAYKIGCDDYIKKPFDLKELEVRIKKLSKEHNLVLNDTVVTDGLFYDEESKVLYSDKTREQLPKKEALVLEYLLKHRGRVISIKELAANIWSYEETPSSSTVRTYIKNLRKLLPEGAITTLKGIGYKFEE